jgi:hypothetical protein
LARGGDLASIHSDEDNTIVFDLTGGDNTAWIGLHENVDEETWHWSDGSQLDFTSWRNGEPNNHGGNEDCGQYLDGHPDYTWNDN